MSYSIPIKFIGIKNRDTLSIIEKIVNYQYDNLPQILKKELYYIPSLRYNSTFPSDNEMELRDENWLIKYILSLKFLVWRQYGLMGVIGSYADKQIDNIHIFPVTFQNSTDQDYDYDEYPRLRFFDEIKLKAQMLTENEIRIFFTLQEEETLSISDLDYYRKWYMYKYVFTTLGLDELDCCSHSSNPPFTIITANAITDHLKLFDAVNRLKHFVKNNKPLDSSASV